MKRKSNLYAQICDFANLELAYRKARRCKRYRAEVLLFSESKEENLTKLQAEFVNHTYRQGAYRTFTVLEPKKRLISALPFRDRVAQHAINNIVEPIVEKRLYYHSYACRKGRGMHKASETLGTWIRNLSFEGVRVYALKCDIRQYFQSIRHDLLKETLRRIIKDPEVLWILDSIIDANGDAVGIPVGNLTSQLFANLFLDALDKFLKEEMRVKYYIRYMDDFIILSDTKQYLWHLLDVITVFLRDRLALRLNPKTTIVCAKNGVDFCGYRHWKDHKKIRKSSVKRMRVRVAAFRRGKIDRDRMEKSLASWMGHIRHADTYHLRRNILAKQGSELHGCDGS